MDNKIMEITKDFKVKFYKTMIDDIEKAMINSSDLEEYEALLNTKSELMSKLWEVENQ